MKSEYYRQIKAQYTASRGDATSLFETLLSIARETGLEAALACLEECVIEKRTSWLKRNVQSFERTGDPVADAYRLFYETYLRLALPQDGELVEAGEKRITVRWRNRCPTLEACQKLGLDTRQVCRLAYERPVQLMLREIDPRLCFERNYSAIRPWADYCEETIYLLSE
jgi:hypothetical protein